MRGCVADHFSWGFSVAFCIVGPYALTILHLVDHLPAPRMVKLMAATRSLTYHQDCMCGNRRGPIMKLSPRCLAVFCPIKPVMPTSQ